MPIDIPDDVQTALPLLKSAETPDLKEILQQFQRAGGQSPVSVQRERNDRIRYNRWKGRTSDYRKHRKAIGADPVPWENGWDGRVHLADGIIEELGDVLSTAFARAQFKSRPAEVGDTEAAGLADKVLLKYRERMRGELRDEAEFLWQFGLHHGASVLQVAWDRRLAMRNAPVTLAKFAEAAQRAVQVLRSTPPAEIPPEMVERLVRLAQLPGAINDPSQEGAAAEIFRLFARDLAGQLFDRERREYGDDFLLGYELSKKDARRVVRELREEGASGVPTPYVAKDQPCIVARQAGVDYLCPPEMTNVQDAAWHLVREWLTPEQVWAGVAQGWDPEWCEAAIKNAGKTSLWTDLASLADANQFHDDDELDAYDYMAADVKSGLIEVCHFYKKYLTAAGVPVIYCTVFCPHVKSHPLRPEEDLYGAHYVADDLPGLYPFVAYRWQKKQRTFITSTGVSQVVGSDQHQIKTSLDMLTDRQEVEVNPSWSVPTRLGMKYLCGPGAQVPVKLGQKVEQMPPPTGSPGLAFELIAHTEKRVSNYFGLMNEHVLPAKWQMKLQRMTERYLEAWQEAWGLVLKMIPRRARPEDLARILGMDPQGAFQPESLAGEWDVSLYFDVKDLDVEFMWKKLDALIKMAVPVDRAGLIDMAQIVRLIVSSIDPTFTTALVQDERTASQKLFKDVREQIALMFQGNLPDFTENDPAAQMKMQFAQQIIFGDGQGQGGNPKYQEALQKDPVFGERMQLWQQNLQQSIAQEKNKQIGRIGVNPEQ